MKLMLDLPRELNTQLKIYRLQNNYKNREEAAIEILDTKLNSKKEEDGIQQI